MNGFNFLNEHVCLCLLYHLYFFTIVLKYYFLTFFFFSPLSLLSLDTWKRSDSNRMSPEAVRSLPDRKLEMPKDLAGKYRFGLSEADLMNVSPKIKELFSFRWANEKEVTEFRANEMRRKFGRDSMDCGSTEVRRKEKREEDGEEER